VADILGLHIQLHSTYDLDDRIYWAELSDDRGSVCETESQTTELEAWQSAVVMAARKRDKLVIGVGDRVDLTGLEVRS